MTEAWKQWEGHTVDGKFTLREYLGGSEHSAVFLTEGEREPQKAALKLIPADPESAELQLSRWRQIARLSHPHLIRIFQMGRCRMENMDLLYVVTEYAEEDLSQVLPHRPLTPAETRDMLGPVLAALAYVHGQGFVHGHLKPANIMAVGDQIKLSSDGLCPISESRSGPDEPGEYDPPEAANGKILPAGDVWSLGITLVEALTQRLPAWEKAGQEDPVLPETVPAPFRELARCCLRREPQHRWTIAQITAWLQRTMSVSQLQKPAIQRSTTSRLPKTFAQPLYILSTVLVGLALAALLLGPTLLNRAPEAQPAPSIEPEQPRKQNASGTVQLPSSLRPGGETKTPKSGLVPGEVFHKVLPEVPKKASDTIQGTVRVRVRVAVDPSGKVVQATLDSPGPSKYFANLALQAARRWEFWAPKVDGRPVPSEWLLRFEFRQTATEASAVAQKESP
jgi:TonB family protein